MRIEMWSIDKVIPYARNARKIPPEAVNKVAASIQEFGFRQPIVVDKVGVIICGHTRLLAAQKLGLTQVPVHVADNLTPAQVRAYRLLDNRSHEESSWDTDLLGFELLDLKTLGLDLDLTGFNSDELDRFLAGAGDGIAGLTDEDAAPDLQEAAVTLTGDCWIAGRHRIVCGDTTDIETIEQLMNGDRADLVFADPPFNIDYHGGRGRSRRRIANDNLGAGFESFLCHACRNMLQVTDGALYICMSSSELHTLKKAFTDAGGHWSTFLIWAKSNFTLGRSDYQRQYEPILYGWREGAEHFWCGARDQSDLWLVNKPTVNELHPTQKPVELIERAIRNSCKPGDTVLDGFAGSGSTLIACETTNRQGRLIELDPRYVDCAVRRFQEFTGIDARLAGDGRTFNEVMAERLQLVRVK
jgi:LSD1 subclass zinc finger protein